MKKEVQYRTQFNPEYKGSPHKNETGISMTKPDLTMSIRTLMTRHTRGVGVDMVERTEYYEDDIGGEVPVITDINDIQEYKEAYKKKAEELKETVKAEKKAAEEKRLKILEDRKNQEKQQQQQQQQKEE